MAQASNTQRRAQMQRRAAAAQRRTTTPRRPPTASTPRFPSRRKPQQSGAQKVLGTLTGALPIGGGAKKVKRSAGKSGGGPSKGLLALAVPAGFAAFKNRDKLRAKLPGQSAPKADVVVPVTEPAPVAHNSGAPAS
jgi:hypothetical protein